MRPLIFTNDNPRPVIEILGERTRWVLTEPELVESFVLEKPRKSRGCGVEGYTILARGPALSAEQITSLQQLVNEPLSYYDGHPHFRRLPSIPELAFQFHRGKSVLDLLVDLHNPGWEFHCEVERSAGWNWVGDEIVALAKALFPEHASAHSRSVWKRGAMKTLANAAEANAT